MGWPVSRNGALGGGGFAADILRLLAAFGKAAALRQAIKIRQAPAYAGEWSAARLKARLVECQGPDQLALLKAEVLNLLTLSFGPAEAQRRLQPLQ